jgi:hypothetical protein
MKCWNLAFNSQGSKEIIVDLKVGALKIYVAVVEELKKKKDKVKFLKPSKLMVFLIPPPIKC